MPGLPKPSAIVRQLDAHVIGQKAAKRTLAVAIYTHYRRLANLAVDSGELGKSNILLIGPTGTGKTLLCETLARSLRGIFEEMMGDILYTVPDHPGIRTVIISSLFEPPRLLGERPPSA